MQTEVIDNRARNRYEIFADARLAGYADYVVRGDRVELPHTVIEPALRGRGLAAVLVRHALDDVRATGRTVVPSCWYVADFIAEHPDYTDLLAD